MASSGFNVFPAHQLRDWTSSTFRRNWTKSCNAVKLVRLGFAPSGKSFMLRLVHRRWPACREQKFLVQCFDELIRQVTVNCAERGLLLLRIRDELRMTIAAYQTLYESSVAFGLRKSLQAECGKADMENRIQQLEGELKELDRQVAEWKNKCDQIEKQNAERKAYEDKKHAEEVAYFTKSNKQLKAQLEAFLAPAKK